MPNMAEVLVAAAVVMPTQRTEKKEVVPSSVQAVGAAERVLVLGQQTVGLAVLGAVMP